MSKKRSAGKTSRRAATPAKAAQKNATKKKTTKYAAPARGTIAIATNKRAAMAERLAAIATLRLGTPGSDRALESLIEILRDKEEPIAVRLRALQALGAAAFGSPSFPAIARDYTAALREVATDPDPELRQQVLGILARDKDGFAQQKLLDGLRDRAKALVPPEKALQLLAYDIHAEAYPIAREIVNHPPNETAKREALRLLGADPGAVPIFERILRDKTETPEIRQVSAAALHGLDPNRLQAQVREIVLDPSEHDEMRETGLTAITQLAPAAVAQDTQLMTRVAQLSAEGTEPVKQSARQLLGKYQR
jgi:hypothetical protein